MLLRVLLSSLMHIPHLTEEHLPANRRNACWSTGRSDKNEVCSVGLKDPPGDVGLGDGGISSILRIEASLAISTERPRVDWAAFDWLSSFSVPWTRKKDSTAGCKTSTAFRSEVRANSLRHSLRVFHSYSKDNWLLSLCNSSFEAWLSWVGKKQNIILQSIVKRGISMGILPCEGPASSALLASVGFSVFPPPHSFDFFRAVSFASDEKKNTTITSQTRLQCFKPSFDKITKLFLTAFLSLFCYIIKNSQILPVLSLTAHTSQRFCIIELKNFSPIIPYIS